MKPSQQLKKFYNSELHHINETISQWEKRRFVRSNRSQEDVEWWGQVVETKIATSVAESSAIKQKLAEIERILDSPCVKEYLSLIETLKIQAAEKQTLALLENIPDLKKLLLSGDVLRYIAISAVLEIKCS